MLGIGLAMLAMQPTYAALPHGISSGDTTQTSTVLWARSGAGLVNFKVLDGSRVVFDQTVAVSRATLPAKIAVTGLTPGKTYRYQVTRADGRSRAGSFKTAAADDAAPALSFGVSGDWRGELAPYPAIKNVQPKNLDFFVKLGDTVYADIPSPALPKAQAETLAEFRRTGQFT